ncbi:MAG: TlpA family protein disulfide reductase [Thermoflexales bacterium]|nr:TlpA family protein disulfide reductase [Thermoflexales bacterium]MCS7324659.1 TlpA family protein disulfide reductase [Thermoflexales bacterium]MDW8053170.1 TlpA disulfide reductase family protein [Anaerolineae bacterium]MDW8291822.1 TlpA disulfide reductase family protein [Anaerolineae bacterium]
MIRLSFVFSPSAKGLLVALAATITFVAAAPVSAQSTRLAPDFQALDTNGREVRLSALRGCGVVLFFFASWCPYCARMAPSIVEAHRALRQRGVIFIGVNVWDADEGLANQFVAQHGISFSIVRQHSEAIADAYRVRGVPNVVMISPRGTIALEIPGWSPDERITQLARRVAGGKSCKVSPQTLP